MSSQTLNFVSHPIVMLIFKNQENKLSLFIKNM